MGVSAGSLISADVSNGFVYFSDRNFDKKLYQQRKFIRVFREGRARNNYG